MAHKHIAGAILALIAAVLLYLLLPPRTIREGFAIKMKNVRSLLVDKSLIIIGLILLGSQTALEQTLAFMPFYIQEAANAEPALAALVESFTLLAALVGSPVAGWIYDKKGSLVKLALVLGGSLLAGTSVNYINTIPASIISTLIVGFAGGGLFALLSKRPVKGLSLVKAGVAWNTLHCP